MVDFMGMMKKAEELQQKMQAMLEEAGVTEIQPGVQRSRLEDLFKRMVLEKRASERGAAAGSGGGR